MAIRVPEPEKNGGLDPLSKAVMGFAVGFFVGLGLTFLIGPSVWWPNPLVGATLILFNAFGLAMTIYYASKPLKE